MCNTLNWKQLTGVIMNELEIRQKIENMLENSTFDLAEFSYDPLIFGNLSAIIYNDTKAYQFSTDRGEIWCNRELIYPNNYHVKGQEDTPVYLMKAIRKLLDDKKITLEQCSETTRTILDKLSDLIELDKMLMSSDIRETKKGPIRFESVILDKENHVKFVAYEDGDIWTSFLFNEKYYYALNYESDQEVIDEAALVFRNVYTYPIKYVLVYKGNKLMKRTLYIDKGNQWEWIGVQYFVLKRLVNPFAKTVTEEILYDFSKNKAQA